MTSRIIRRSGQNLILELPAAMAWPQACQALEDCLMAAQSLVTGQRAALHVGDHTLETESLTELKDFLSQRYALELTCVIGNQEAQAEVVKGVELPWQLEESSEEDLTNLPAAPDAGELRGLISDNAYYVRQTIRSGQSLRHFGTVVICGDVNPGAEVIATGDIIVFGTLRGVAHAGATGDDGAQIVAINLRPTQIRIAGFIARSPDSASPPLSKYPEVARIQDNEIHILPLRDTI